jgi:membrane protein DedA with SNARE-associated domain
MFAEWFAKLASWYQGQLDQHGCALVALLMAVESSIVPLPSEVVIPPAAHLVYTRGAITLWKGCSIEGVTAGMVALVIAGAVGSWLGATAMYWASRLLGRPLVMRFGRYVFIPPAKVEGAERWAAHYGSMGIFMARLLPVVRHLIGIPAGIVRLNYWKYSLYTLVGSAIWSAALCWIGVQAGQDEKLLAGDMHRVTLWLGGAMIVLGAMYYFMVHRHMHRPPPAK